MAQQGAASFDVAPLPEHRLDGERGAGRGAHHAHAGGEGDGRAAQIYAQAYSRDPEFYEFYRSLSAYRNSFRGKDDILLLKPDSDFFKYFNDPSRR